VTSFRRVLETVVRIEHVAIWCEDLELLREFYETYFSADSSNKYVNMDKGLESYFLTFESGARLELMHMQSIPASANDPYRQYAGLTHLAISVGSANQVNELTRRLLESGFEVIDGPRRTGDGYYESVVMDPENNRIEITV